MREVEFREWLKEGGMNTKVIGDTLSRLRRIEKEIKNCDIDEQYRRDRCQYLLEMFRNMGNNDFMNQCENSNLPIGKYYMNTYRLALKKYISFLDSLILEW